MESSNLRIRVVENREDLMKFIKFPWRVYQRDTYWVPPLIRERVAFLDRTKNPFFNHSEVVLFLADRDGETVGTIAAIIDDNYIRFHDEKVGFFGLFEVIEDFGVAERLLSTAKDWVKSKGMEVIRGPMNFSTNQECGLLVEGFNSRPVVMMTYNPRYYIAVVEKFGFIKARDLYAYTVNLDIFGSKGEKLPEKLIRIAERVQREEKVCVRNVNLRDFDAEVERVKGVYNSAWSKNWGFVPMTNDEFLLLAKGLKPFLDPDLVFIAEVAGSPIGFSLTIPDINQPLAKINGRLFPLGALKLMWHRRKIDTLRVLAMGLTEEYRLRGIDAIFYLETVKGAIRNGYTCAEMSWVLEDNIAVIRAIEMMGGRIYKKYRIYETPL